MIVYFAKTAFVWAVFMWAGALIALVDIPLGTLVAASNVLTAWGWGVFPPLDASETS